MTGAPEALRAGTLWIAMAPIASREERPLGVAELLACVTDATGRIRATDPAFLARTGYGAGEPLEALRHPDMPHTVHLPGTAYVRALARDGTWFWAMALATPVADGHLVVAFRPGTARFEEAREIYGGVRAAELGGSRLVAASQAT